jgi:hypothetical protein
MRQDHLKQIERWAYFVKNNPHHWKKIHSEFINALFRKHYEFNERLSKLPQGKAKLALLRKLRLNNWGR